MKKVRASGLVLDIEDTDGCSRVSMLHTPELAEWLHERKFEWEPYGREVVVHIYKPQDLVLLKLIWGGEQ